jgi:hypothetical protein
LLASQTPLASTLLSPFSFPGPSLRKRLSKVIEDDKNGSFADYARFALARSYLHGAGRRLNEQTLTDGQMRFQGTKRGYREEMRSRLQWDLTRPFEDLAQRRGILARGVLADSEPIEGWADELDDLLHAEGARRAPPEERFVSLLIVTDEDRAAALHYLEQIVSHEFPYYPNALALRLLALPADADATRKEIKRILRSEFPDAVETLEVLAPDMTDDEWVKYRVHPATQPVVPPKP